MFEDEEKPARQTGTQALSIALVILFIVCLLIALWVLMIVVRFFMGLG